MTQSQRRNEKRLIKKIHRNRLLFQSITHNLYTIECLRRPNQPNFRYRLSGHTRTCLRAVEPTLHPVSLEFFTIFFHIPMTLYNNYDVMKVVCKRQLTRITGVFGSRDERNLSINRTQDLMENLTAEKSSPPALIITPNSNISFPIMT